jgi:outer membrane murein-binding lipoprotein Lpp
MAAEPSTIGINVQHLILGLISVSIVSFCTYLANGMNEGKANTSQILQNQAVAIEKINQLVKDSDKLASRVDYLASRVDYLERQLKAPNNTDANTK